MRILVTYGSTRGGTQGLAEMVADHLRAEGFDVDVRPPRQVKRLEGYDAVIVGGALYAFRWHRAARTFVKRHAAEIRQRPGVLLLQRAARRFRRPRRHPAGQRRQGAHGKDRSARARHLRRAASAEAKGFPASAMAKKRAGDWRDAEHVQRWTRTIASQLHGEVRQDA